MIVKGAKPKNLDGSKNIAIKEINIKMLPMTNNMSCTHVLQVKRTGHYKT